MAPSGADEQNQLDGARERKSEASRPPQSPLPQRGGRPTRGVIPSTAFGRPAHVWHSERRATLLRHEGVRALVKAGASTRWTELCWSFGIAFGVLALHGYVAIGLREFAATASVWKSSLTVLLCSATVGGQCAFLLQALNHEISHAVIFASCSGAGIIRRAIFWFGLVVGNIGAALCHVPWAAYYFGGGHQRHHRLAGSRLDVDGDALFYLWNPPLESAPSRFIWLSFAAMVVPLAYALSLLSFAVRHPRANVVEVTLVGLHAFLTYKFCSSFGFVAASYWMVSSWFSMGFMCHPLAAFWILQHFCVEGIQPTVSYRGSRLWNWLTLNELLHVEHHDIAKLSFRWMPHLEKVVPEMYDGLYSEGSVCGLLWAWMHNTLAKPGAEIEGMDFGCRAAWGHLPGGPAHQEEYYEDSDDNLCNGPPAPQPVKVPGPKAGPPTPETKKDD